jgi:hypothetical protein
LANFFDLIFKINIGVSDNFEVRADFLGTGSSYPGYTYYLRSNGAFDATESDWEVYANPALSVLQILEFTPGQGITIRASVSHTYDSDEWYTNIATVEGTAITATIENDTVVFTDATTNLSNTFLMLEIFARNGSTIRMDNLQVRTL